MQIFIVYIDDIKDRFDPQYLINAKEINNLKSNYQLKKLSDLLINPPQYGANERAIDRNIKQDIRYIRITDIDEYGNLKNDEWKTAEHIDNKYLLQSDDLLFARSGATAGKTFIYKQNHEPAIFAGYLIRFRFDTSKVLPAYVFYYTQLPSYQKWVKSIQRPSGQPNINSEEFKSLLIPLPPLDKQNQVVKIFNNSYQQKQQKKKEAQELLDSIDDYVLKELGIIMPEMKNEMIYFTYSKDIEDKRADANYHQPKFKIIENALLNGKYPIKKLREYITKIHYGVSIKNTYIDNGISLLRILNLKPNALDLKNVVNLADSERELIGNGFVYKDDLLISRSGTIGIVAVVPDEADGFAFGSFMIKFCLNDHINKKFVSIWLNNRIAKLLTEREKIGAIQGNITIETIENFQIPCPPLETQNKIVTEVENITFQAKKLQQEAESAIREAQKQTAEMIFA